MIYNKKRLSLPLIQTRKMVILGQLLSCLSSSCIVNMQHNFPILQLIVICQLLLPLCSIHSDNKFASLEDIANNMPAISDFSNSTNPKELSDSLKAVLSASTSKVTPSN